jgi:endonuclease/exonuclease/phosphatase family metal-dependent hydrolase
VLHGEFDIGGNPFHFFNTHLSLSREARKRTTREVTAFADRYSGPKILVGDFNEVSHEDPIRHVVEEASFCDGWAFLHPGAAGLTYSDTNRYIKDESETGGRRIDYVFGRDGTTIERCEIAGNTASEDGHFPSDHFGLVATVSIGGTT